MPRWRAARWRSRARSRSARRSTHVRAGLWTSAHGHLAARTLAAGAGARLGHRVRARARAGCLGAVGERGRPGHSPRRAAAAGADGALRAGRARALSHRRPRGRAPRARRARARRLGARAPRRTGVRRRPVHGGDGDADRAGRLPAHRPHGGPALAGAGDCAELRRAGGAGLPRRGVPAALVRARPMVGTGRLGLAVRTRPPGEFRRTTWSPRSPSRSRPG